MDSKSWDEILREGVEGMLAASESIPSLLLCELVSLHAPTTMGGAGPEDSDEKKLHQLPPIVIVEPRDSAGINQYLLHEVWPNYVTSGVWARVRAESQKAQKLANKKYESYRVKIEHIDNEIVRIGEIVSLFEDGIDESTMEKRWAPYVSGDVDEILDLRKNPTEVARIKLALTKYKRRRDNLPVFKELETFYPSCLAKTKEQLRVLDTKELLAGVRYQEFCSVYGRYIGIEQDYANEASRHIMDMELPPPDTTRDVGSVADTFRAEPGVGSDTLVYIPGVAKTSYGKLIYDQNRVLMRSVSLTNPKTGTRAARALVACICERERNKSVVAVQMEDPFGLGQYFAWYCPPEIVMPSLFLSMPQWTRGLNFRFLTQNASWVFDDYVERQIEDERVNAAAAVFGCTTGTVWIYGAMISASVCSVSTFAMCTEAKRIHPVLMAIGVLHLLSLATKREVACAVVANGLFSPEEWGGVPLVGGDATPAGARDGKYVYTPDALVASSGYRTLSVGLSALFDQVQSMLDSDPDPEQFKNRVAELMFSRPKQQSGGT